MNAQPAFKIPMIDAIKSVVLGSITKTLLPGVTPFLISAFAIRFAFSLNSAYVNVSSHATIAVSPAFSKACLSKRLWMNGFSTGVKRGIS